MARQNKYQHPGDIRLPERAESFCGVDQGYCVGHYFADNKMETIG